jgi:hypothetical protein
MKLRKGKKYLVKQGRDFPVAAKYRGKQDNNGTMMHLFLFCGDEFSGLYFNDKLKGVEEYSKKREAEIRRAAERELARV